ncbi:glycerophosphodiester phosphodiesterase [Aureivirga marina]|uniref:glycerophosphodiester phosphodiesterase n=1 Tax=Aureivirga marina TaxID=1182451 RepID=UPI0018C935A1|nr:glycerophosphodiester phosphodiesterase family protein [Aureivirga marina]
MKKTIVGLFVMVITLISCSKDENLVQTTTSQREINSFSSQKAITITGHRGAANLAPENTISALNAGISHGVQRVEIDVHVTSDGIPIVMHDDSVDRTTNGTGLVKDLTYEYIKTLDAGSHFSEEFKGEKVPTLDEALKAVNGRATLLIEIKNDKGYYPEIEQKVVDLIHQNNALEWSIVQSFETPTLENVHNIDPTIELHKLFMAKVNFNQNEAENIDAKTENFDIMEYEYISEYSIFYLFATKNVIDSAHQEGKKVNAWTVNDSITAGILKLNGIDGLITDSPDRIK